MAFVAWATSCGEMAAFAYLRRARTDVSKHGVMSVMCYFIYQMDVDVIINFACFPCWKSNIELIRNLGFNGRF